MYVFLGSGLRRWRSIASIGVSRSRSTSQRPAIFLSAILAPPQRPNSWPAQLLRGVIVFQFQ
jgi:hypothetical protein